MKVKRCLWVRVRLNNVNHLSGRVLASDLETVGTMGVCVRGSWFGSRQARRYRANQRPRRSSLYVRLALVLLLHVTVLRIVASGFRVLLKMLTVPPV